MQCWPVDFLGERLDDIERGNERGDAGDGEHQWRALREHGERRGCARQDHDAGGTVRGPPEIPVPTPSPDGATHAARDAQREPGTPARQLGGELPVEQHDGTYVADARRKVNGADERAPTCERWE